MSLSKAALKSAIGPYMVWIKVGLLLAIATVIFSRGCSYGKSTNATQIATLQGQLREAGVQLGAAKSLLEEVNAEAKRHLAAEKKALEDSARAGATAATALKRAEKRIAAYDNELSRARRRSPDCAALLNADLAKVCGL